MQYQIPGIIRQIDGATKQQTYPVPGVSQPQVLARFDVNRIVGAPPRFEGATVQRTDPIPPVSQPQRLAPFDVNRIVPAPPRVEGAKVQRTDPLPPIRFGTPYRVTRQLIGAPRYLDGAIVDTNSYIFPTSQPLSLGRIAQQVPLAQRLENPTAVVSQDVYSTAQPSFTLKQPQQPRSVVYFDGATIQQTYIFPVSLPQTLPPFDVNRIVPAPVRLEGSTSQQTYIFPVSQPYLKVPQQQPECPRYWYGATIQQTFPVPGVSQPQTLAPFDVNRLTAPPPRFEGATIAPQQTYIFAPIQPLNYNSVQQPVQAVRWEGATVQQTYLFPVNQALNYLPTMQPVAAPVRFDGPVIPPGQTYIFPPNQPMVYLASRQPLDAPRYWYGATIQQQYIFPVSQPVVLADKRQQPLLTVPRFDGDFTWFGYPLSQPIKTVPTQQPIARYLDIPRIVQVDLPLVLLNPFQVPRQQSVQQPRVEGSTRQQTYIFPNGQPLNYLPWRLPIDATRFYDGIITPPILPIRPIGFAVSAGPVGTIQSAGAVGVVLPGSPKGNIV